MDGNEHGLPSLLTGGNCSALVEYGGKFQIQCPVGSQERHPRLFLYFHVTGLSERKDALLNPSPAQSCRSSAAAALGSPAGTHSAQQAGAPATATGHPSPRKRDSPGVSAELPQPGIARQLRASAALQPEAQAAERSSHLKALQAELLVSCPRRVHTTYTARRRGRRRGRGSFLKSRQTKKGKERKGKEVSVRDSWSTSTSWQVRSLLHLRSSAHLSS